jgi:ankyrin repeat protein
MSLVIASLLESGSSLETILALMERGEFDIDYQELGWPGRTPLLTAIVKKREDVALELIQRGANLELANYSDTTPLSLACVYNLQSTARALVRAGADIDRASIIRTPLGWAAAYGHLSLVRAMLSWGADPNRVGATQETARAVANKWGHNGVTEFLDACGSILVVRSAEEVHRLAKQSALKHLPKDLGRMLGAMLV